MIHHDAARTRMPEPSSRPSYLEVAALFAQTHPTAVLETIVPLAPRLYAQHGARCGWQITFTRSGVACTEVALWLGTRFHLVRTLDAFRPASLIPVETEAGAAPRSGPIIVTLGYRQEGAEEQLARLVAEDYLILDIRKRAGSRFDPAYNRGQLAQRFPQAYHRIPELGNTNYPHRPFLLVDQETGLRHALTLLEGRPGAILLCACADWQECHRSLVAELLQARRPEIQIQHAAEARDEKSPGAPLAAIVETSEEKEEKRRVPC